MFARWWISVLLWGLAPLTVGPSRAPVAAAPALLSVAMASEPRDAEPKKPKAARADASKPGEGEEKKEEKKPEKKDELDDFDEVTKDAEKTEGLFTLYKKKDKLYLEIKPEQLDRDHIMTLTLESGIGERGILNGLPIDDFLWRFRRVNDQIHFVKRNPWFRAKAGQPANRSLERAFTDSVLASLKLESVHKEKKTLLVDAAPLFMTDLAGLSNALRGALQSGYAMDPSKTYWGMAKSFPQNTELETCFSFSSAQPSALEAVPDSRNVTLRVRYSLSELPQDSFRPRLADSRVGYFLTAYQDFSSDDDPSPFVRYINRWNLQKKDPDAPLSETKKPIVFWLENTIPLEYRDAVREGVLRWNAAFEKAGFKNAIQVKQQPDDADWDPADIRYNTIRWIYSLEASFGAMGPSRVNPLTGEILDADIVVDASMLRGVRHQYRVVAAPVASGHPYLAPSLKGAPVDPEVATLLEVSNPTLLTAEDVAKLDPKRLDRLCMAGLNAASEAGFAAIALGLRDGMGTDGDVPKEYLDQFIGDVIAHEVGHTLGLRHNFHASTLLPLSQLNNRALVAEKGLWSSVMDYNPPNIALVKSQQGYYFSPRVGPYDEWAIEYGYKPITAPDPEGELSSLRQIAERGTDPALAYATDEDTYDFLGPTSVDPLAMTGDLSDDPIGFSKQRMQLAKLLLKRLEARGPGQGKSYDEFRRDFGWIIGAYSGAGARLSKWVGGQYFSRNHAGDRGGTLPLTPVPAAKQREALAAIREYLLAENAFQFSPDMLNKLAPSRWSHWGANPFGSGSFDYPVLQLIETMQWNAMARFYHPALLRRLQNTELKVKSPGDALTLPELFTGLTNSLWSEVLTGPSRSITTPRRTIQRDQLDVMIMMVVQPMMGTPDDARSLARAEIRRLQTAIRKALAPPAANAKAKPLDAYTRAHLEDADARISKALAAPLISS
jgi:hypothetical protein